jgi:hypothetical protein
MGSVVSVTSLPRFTPEERRTGLEAEWVSELVCTKRIEENACAPAGV